MKVEQGQNGVISSKVASVDYHNNEDQFNDNLNDFLRNPLPISSLVQNIQISEKEITIGKITPKIYVDEYNVHENIKI